MFDLDELRNIPKSREIADHIIDMRNRGRSLREVQDFIDKINFMNEDFHKQERKCRWTDCKFCVNGVCKQKDGGGIAYAMDAIGRYKHELQSEEVKQHCRCCIPDLGQYNKEGNND